MSQCETNSGGLNQENFTLPILSLTKISSTRAGMMFVELIWSYSFFAVLN